MEPQINVTRNLTYLNHALFCDQMEAASLIGTFRFCKFQIRFGVSIFDCEKKKAYSVRYEDQGGDSL